MQRKLDTSHYESQTEPGWARDAQILTKALLSKGTTNTFFEPEEKQ
jgi:hypothetical protein